MDALSLLIDGLHLRARVTYAGGVCGRWAIDHNSRTAIWFHLLTKGDAWIHCTAWPTPRRVFAGDLVTFLPHAPTHYLSYSADDLRFDAEDAAKTAFEHGSTAFVCGAIELDAPDAMLWRMLPPDIVIRRAEAGASLAQLVALIVAEASEPRLAADALIERLCDGFFVLVVRHCLERDLCSAGVLTALRDPRLLQVLTLMHADPPRSWTLGALCLQAGISRSALIERFTTLLGCPPIEYLTRWRMRLAANWLREPGMTIERVAERCGYDSVSAFSRAFKRHHGAAPGSLRRPQPPSPS